MTLRSLTLTPVLFALGATLAWGACDGAAAPSLSQGEHALEGVPEADEPTEDPTPADPALLACEAEQEACFLATPAGEDFSPCIEAFLGCMADNVQPVPPGPPPTEGPGLCDYTLERCLGAAEPDEPEGCFEDYDACMDSVSVP